MTKTAVPTAAELVARAGDNVSPERAHLIEDAYGFAAECHVGQLRKSGDPYIVHPVDAAMTIAGLNQDGAALAAAPPRADGDLRPPRPPPRPRPDRPRARGPRLPLRRAGGLHAHQPAPRRQPRR